MLLRPYQERSLDELRSGIASGHRCQILMAGTGSGKTVMGAHLMQAAQAKGKRAAFIVDRIPLIEQASRTFDAFGIDHGIIQAGHWRWRPHATAQICSAQTLARRGFQPFDLAIVDECHTCYKATTEYVQRSGAIVVGLTATPFTKGLGKIYSRVVNVVSTNQLVNEGWLVPLKMFAAKEIDMTGAKLNSKGEWDEREIEQRGHKIVGDIVTEWVAKTHQYFSGPAKTIVFSATVDHGRDLCGQFNAAGYRFEQISYRDSDERRAELIREFSKADSDIVGLISCEALAKGFDVPDIRIGVCARPYRKSLSGHIQQLGRVMRPHPGKDFALWLDHAGNLLRFMEDTEEVFENGVSELDDGKLDSAVRKEKTDTEKKQIVCSCGFVLAPYMTSCPACGKERTRLSLVVSAPGEMQEVDGKKANRQFSTAEKRAFYAQLVHYGIHKNYKPGWPANKYRERFGVWPNAHKNVSPMIPDPKTLAWIKYSTIKWSKGRAA